MGNVEVAARDKSAARDRVRVERRAAHQLPISVLSNADRMKPTMCTKTIRATNALIGGILGLALCIAPVFGGYVLVEDFNDLDLAPISGQDDWSAGSGNLVVADPVDTTNQVLSVASQSTTARKPTLLSQGTVRMFFLRFRFADQLTASFGLSASSVPTEFGDFGPELSLTNTSSELRIANGLTTGIYDDLTPLTADTWYNVWLLVDHVNQTSQVWLNTGSGGVAMAADQLLNDDNEESFGFRAASSNDLVNFYLKTGSGGSGSFGPLWIDDLYLEDSNALNLSNPTAPLPGDFNLSGTVDGDDLFRWETQFGAGAGADADGDGDSDGADFLIWQQHFDTGNAPTALAWTIPEPGSWLLLSMALLSTLCCDRWSTRSIRRRNVPQSIRRVFRNAR